MKFGGFLLIDCSPPDEQNGTALLKHMQKSLNSMRKLLPVRDVGCRPILVRDDREIMDGYNVIARIKYIMGALVRPVSLQHSDSFLQICGSSVNLPELPELHKTFEPIF